MKSSSVLGLKMQEASIIDFETIEVPSKIKQSRLEWCARILREERVQGRPRSGKRVPGEEVNDFANSMNNNGLQLKRNGFLKSSSVL